MSLATSYAKVMTFFALLPDCRPFLASPSLNLILVQVPMTFPPVYQDSNPLFLIEAAAPM